MTTTRTISTSCLAALLSVSLATPARAADERSRAKPENTVESCSDHLDNDFDGFEDCEDQDCQELTICASHSGRSGGGGTRTQQQSVQMQPRVVYVRALTPQERRARAMSKIIAGGLMVSFGFFGLGAGAGLYAYGFTTNDNDGGRYYGGIAGGTLLSLAGLALIGTGGAFLAIGSADLSQNPAPASEQVAGLGMPGLRVSF